MRILFVEDNEEFAASHGKKLSELDGVRQVETVRSRDAALTRLAGELYDCMVLDIKILAADGEVVPQVEFGREVFHAAQESCPGLPIIILTGSELDEWMKDLSRHGEKLDVWGTGAFPTVIFIEKDRADKSLEEVGYLTGLMKSMQDVEIDRQGQNLDLTPFELRALRVVGARRGGAEVRVRQLGGGRSSAKVLRTSILDGRGNTIAQAAGKIGPRDEIRNEIGSYRKHVDRIKPGAFPPLLDVVEAGVGGTAAVFYGLMGDYDRTFFELAAARPDEAAKAVEIVRGQLKTWSDAAQVETVAASVLRRRLLSDEKLEVLMEKHDLEFVNEIEKLKVRARLGISHGDLHGGNLLVDSEAKTVLIDFGDVEHGSICLDPVTLELSMAFHPDAMAAGLSIPLLDTILDWPNLDQYSIGAPVRPVVEACRNWAHEMANEREVAITAFHYVLRQLQYKNVDEALNIEVAKRLYEKIRQLYKD